MSMEFSFKKEIKNTLLRCCIYFTVVTSINMLIFAFSDANFVAYDILFLLLFAFLLSLAGILRTIKKMHISLRVALHYIICIFAVYTCIFLPYNFQPNPTIVGLALTTILYAIVGIIIGVFNARLRAKKEERETYKKQYPSTNNKKRK